MPIPRLSRLTVRSSPQVNVNHPSPSVKHRLHNSVSKNFAEEVAQQQIKSGYKPDKWKQSRLRDVRSSVSDHATYKAFASSLLHGPSSLWLPHRDISHELVDDIEKMINERAYPKGTTNYFGDLTTLRNLRIHDKVPQVHRDSEQSDFHQYVQVAKKYCTEKSSRETLVALRDHKDTVGIFNRLPEWLFDMPVAYSIVEANNMFKLKLKNGELIDVKVGAYEGNVIQIVVPMTLLPFFHAGCSRVIYQKYDNTYGVASPHVDKEGNIEWILKYNANDSKVIHLPSSKDYDLIEKKKEKSEHEVDKHAVDKKHHHRAHHPHH